jgi:hypothetical protein
MAIKTAGSILLLSLIALMCIYAQCNKRLDCANTVYSFEMGIKAYPDKDSINVGDTIWLEVNEPTTLKDALSGRVIDYSGVVNLGTAISFAKLIAVSQTNDQVAANFKFILLQGNEIARPDTAKYREFNFRELNGFYKFQLAIIPKETGVFKMFVSSAANVYRKNDKCTKAGFTINFKETNQHFYFNEVSFPGIILSGKNGVYLFKVK